MAEKEFRSGCMREKGLLHLSFHPVHSFLASLPLCDIPDTRDTLLFRGYFVAVTIEIPVSVYAMRYLARGWTTTASILLRLCLSLRLDV